MVQLDEALVQHSRLCPVACSTADPLCCIIFPLRHHMQLPKLCISDGGRGASQQALPRRRLGERDDVPDGASSCITRAASTSDCWQQGTRTSIHSCDFSRKGRQQEKAEP